jgi:YVTN family beta-propeller protein
MEKFRAILRKQSLYVRSRFIMATFFSLFSVMFLHAASAGLLLVANQVTHTLLVVDPDSGKQLAVVTLGVNDHEVAASPDGKFAYAPIYSNVGLGAAGTNGQTIDVVDIATGKLAYSIDLGKPVRPHKAVFAPDGLLYVTAELDNAIYIVDPAARKVIGSIPTGEPQSHMIAIHGDRGYTANVSTGTVSVLDLKQRKLISEIHVADNIQRISVSPDGNSVFTHAKDNRVIVIDAANDRVKTSIPMPTTPYSSAVTNDGKFLVVLFPSEPKALVVDLSTYKVAHEVELPRAATEMLMDPRGGVAYISCFSSGQIAVLNLNAWKIDRMINLSTGVDGLAWAQAAAGAH